MPYDEGLAQRVRGLLGHRYGVVERKMFGGLAFMLNGNMCCCLSGEELVVRTGPDQYESALERPHARICAFTGRPMRGFVQVAAEGFREDAVLGEWLDLGLAFAGSLPPK